MAVCDGLLLNGIGEVWIGGEEKSCVEQATRITGKKHTMCLNVFMDIPNNSDSHQRIFQRAG